MLIIDVFSNFKNKVGDFLGNISYSVYNEEFDQADKFDIIVPIVIDDYEILAKQDESIQRKCIYPEVNTAQLCHNKQRFNDFIIDYLIRASAKNLLFTLAYQISNGGVYKHTAENAESVSKSEVDYLMVQQRTKQEVYGLRMQKWLIKNSVPEYLQFSEIISRRRQNVGSWYFGNGSDCCTKADEYL